MNERIEFLEQKDNKEKFLLDISGLKNIPRVNDYVKINGKTYIVEPSAELSFAEEEVGGYNDGIELEEFAIWKIPVRKISD